MEFGTLHIDGAEYGGMTVVTVFPGMPGLGSWKARIDVSDDDAVGRILTGPRAGELEIDGRRGRVVATGTSGSWLELSGSGPPPSEA